MVASVALVAVGCVAIGWMVGATSIGGFLIVPLLILVLDMPVGEAVATSLITYVPAGAMAVYLYYRSRRIDVWLGIALGIVGLPGVWMGILLSRWMSDRGAEVALSGLLVGLSAYLGRQVWVARRTRAAEIGGGAPAAGSATPGRAAVDPAAALEAPAGERAAGGAGNERERDGSIPGPVWRAPVAAALLGAGAIVSGAAASLAGVGGALIQVPLMVALNVTPGVAIGTGLLSSWLTAVVASLGKSLDVSPDLGIVPLVTVTYMVGLWTGERSARRIRVEAMRAVIAVVCFFAAVAVLM